MKKVLLYWNHICVLHNEEKKQLAKAQEALLKQDIELEIKFFGMGYESHMCEYLAKEDAILPDVMVSADLEVVEHHRIFKKLGDLHPCEGWLPLKNSSKIQAIRRKETLLPFIAIPLVCYTRDLEHCRGKTLVEMSKSSGFAFGGINNSAGKTITKLCLQEYGEEITRELLQNSSIFDMPIASFQSVRTGENTTALVPTLYAQRQDGETTHMTTLAEGTFLLPSFFACRQSVSQEIGKAVMAEILTPEFCEFYAQQGSLLICPEIKTTTRLEEDFEDFAVLSQSFLDGLDNQKFYELYTDFIPTARVLK
ncbi:MAG: hypothetical protein R3Y07_04940 [Eubacteriales bacterium]